MLKNEPEEQMNIVAPLRLITFTLNSTVAKKRKIFDK
jgi:hypothetical protein